MSRSVTYLVALFFALCLALSPSLARAQACCSGASAVTPGRLALHDEALIGMLLRGSAVVGSHDERGRYRSAPSSSRERNMELDLIGAVRVLDRAQLALSVPLQLTHRSLLGLSETGGGLGDVNLSTRIDWTLAGASRRVPGIALLAGLSLPTGRGAEEARKPLSTDATGLGVWELTVGAAVEQLFGPVLVGATALVSARGDKERQGHTRGLSPRFTGLLSVAYTFSSEAALALSMQHLREGDASVDEVSIAGSRLRSTTVTFSGLLPLSDTLRLSAGVFSGLPFDTIGMGAPMNAGLSLAVFKTWM